MASKSITITFADDEDGETYETKSSIVNRISKTFGFAQNSITLMEASYIGFKLAGKNHVVCNSVNFTVNGIGWATDFENIDRSPAFDE